MAQLVVVSIKMPQTQNLPPPPKLSTQGSCNLSMLIISANSSFRGRAFRNSTVLLHTSCNKFSLLHHIILVAPILSPPTERPTAIYTEHVGSISLVRFHFTEYTEHKRRGGGEDMRHPLTQRRANQY